MKLSSYFPWEISNSLLKWVEGKLMEGDGGRRGDKYGVTHRDSCLETDGIRELI